MKKGIVYNLNPFNNETDMSSAEYIIKKLLAFILIYVISAVLGEGVIIGILYGMGYDPLHGIMPAGEISELLPYYGFLIFSLVTLLYCRFVEKKNIKSVGFSGNPADYLTGISVAAILLFVILGIGCLCGSISFCGFNTNVSITGILLWALAFGIQGAAEEIMCRGFLLNSLKNRIPIPLAILISSTAFVFPHLSSLVEADSVYVVVGIINLYLVSIVFSMLVLWRSNIWIACGLHSAWNFILYVIMGLSLSGSESVSKGVVLFSVKDASILNGAEYGIEASVITTAVLGMLLFFMVKRWKGRICRNDIS
ncbi:MAG: CPBP family intramembrane metalloprotease [Ruminococcaceae bacterium]|nr:CPBP family intramembrane metalloprotease [Oscillospiraceae bacterium]